MCHFWVYMYIGVYSIEGPPDIILENGCFDQIVVISAPEVPPSYILTLAKIMCVGETILIANTTIITYLPQRTRKIIHAIVRCHSRCRKLRCLSTCANLFPMGNKLLWYFLQW